MRKQATNGLVYLLNTQEPQRHADDVECFFSMMRDLLGSSFRLTTVMQEWRKICVEFDKRVIPNFHSIIPIMTVIMRENAPHLTNQPTMQVDWRFLGRHVVSKQAHLFLGELA